MRKKKVYQHKEILEGLYLEQNLTMRQIAEICGVAVTTIFYWLQKLDIPTRDFDIGSVNREKSLSDDVKQKLSIFAKERFKNPENHPMKGRCHTEESRRKMSETKKLRNALRRQGIYQP